MRLDRPLAGDAPDKEYRIRLGSIGAQYFGTLGIPLVAGRDFAGTDFDEKARGLIVNQAFVRRLLGDGDPIGRGIRLGETDADTYRVIGVVGDVVAVKLDQSADAVAYLPFTHFTLPFMRLMARGPAAPATR